MKIGQITLAIGCLLSSGYSMASPLTVNNATVTKVRVYETADNGTTAWIHLNNKSNVGPNPANTSNECELWTNNQSVYSAALAALMSGNKVDVSYRDRGEGTYWCNVRSLSVNGQ